ncbi:CHAT domain-containing protein [Mycena epipterygia]|nr:CHAT domain-containing protein [Mycena epipterygia]
MQNNSPPGSPDPPAASELVTLADGILRDCMAESSLANLDTTIYLLAQTSVNYSPLGSQRLNLLATALLTRFSYTGQWKDVWIAGAIHRSLITASISVISGPLQNLLSSQLNLDSLQVDESPANIVKLAGNILAEFHQSVNLSSLNTAIVLYEEALSAQDSLGPETSRTLRQLANSHLIQFRTTGDTDRVQKSISLVRQVHTAHPNQVSCLCAALLSEAVITNILEADGLIQEALKSGDKAFELAQSGIKFLEVFEQSGDDLNLDMAISALAAAGAQVPWGHHNYASVINNSGNALVKRFRTRGDSADLDNAIWLHREALDLRPAPHPDRVSSLSNLATGLHERFKTRGDPADLDNAIGLLREALDVHPAPHPDRGGCLNNLANVLHERFQTRGDAGDLDNAIDFHCEALDLHPRSHPGRDGSLNNLANALHERFQRRGDAGDLEYAIELYREALELHPAPHPDRGGSVNSLATVLVKRFQTRGDPADLDNAIELLHEALDLHTVPHPNRSMSLNTLATVLRQRFQTRGDSGDLDNAIELHREALDLRPAPHRDHIICLNNLANALHERSQTRGDAGDLADAIELHREALELYPAPHPDCGTFLNNLAIGLHDRFHTRGDPADLDNAIELHREALDLCPRPHPSRGLFLVKLAQTLITKYDDCLELNVIKNAVVAFQEGSAYLPSPVSLRCKTSALWARDAEERNHDSAFEAYETAVELLPQQAMLGLDIHSRQQALTLSSIGGLVLDAATYASQRNNMGKAVEFLETGRSVFWSQALQLHPSLDDLQAVHPDLAERILEISKKLEAGSHRNVASTRMLPAVHKDHMMLDKEDTHYRKLNAEWVQIVGQVRQQPGFNRFLQPKLIDELRQAAIHGPIIILNASEFACSAFMVTLSDVQCVNLENMTWERTQLLVDLLHALLNRSTVQIIQTLTKIPAQEVSTKVPTLQERLEGTVESSENLNTNKVFGWLLAELWTLIVEPVFRALELKKSDNPSRLWWCPTGPFTFLPIHAAGLYEPLRTDCVSDYIVSSYTPTLTTLLDPPTHPASSFKMTALIQPTTEDCLDLPATVEELAQIKQHVPTQWLTSLGDADPATVEIALHHLQESSVVHFACHGTQDLKNPLETGLHLTDGRLKVSELMQGKSNKKSMSLAFLSACETAKGDEKVPDEAMHLAATLLFSGFRGVVATMWTMADPDGPKMAGTFYEYLFKGCNATADPPVLPDLTKAAEALHIAVTELRADPSVPFSRWVPFVHYGL